MMLLAGCSYKPTIAPVNNYMTLNNVWEKKYSKEKIVQIYGQKFKEVPEGILYDDSNNNPEKGFYFDAKMMLVEQFIVLNQNEFDSFLKEVTCYWIHQEEVKHMSHYFRVIKKGECKKYSVSYVQDSSLKSYEMRWRNRD
jgi:hypothetical protein